MSSNDIDMSRPGTELFPESSMGSNNSYPGVNSEHVAEAQPYSAGVKDQFDVAGQQAGEKSNQQYNWEASRAELSKMQAEREYWKGQAEAFNSQRQLEPQRADVDPFKGWDLEDTPRGKDVKDAFEHMRQENQKLREEFSDALKAVQTKSTHQDWQQKVTQHVPELTGKNPIFAEMIRNSSNPYEAAYQLAELASSRNQGQSQQQAPQQPPMSPDAQRAIYNASKPQSPNMVGGQSTLNQADYYANMSDEDFMRMAARNLANI